MSRDEKRALKFYQQAAEQGCADAQYILGLYYGGTRIFQLAVQFFKQAAVQDHQGAQVSLGHCYWQGQGVLEDRKRAIEFYQQAAMMGNEYALHVLGFCLRDGQGILKNFNRAILLFQTFKKADMVLSLQELHKLTPDVPHTLELAVEYYANAADKGNSMAQSTLGFCYQLGVCVKKNIDKAIALYRQALRQKEFHCLLDLWFCYQRESRKTIDINEIITGCQQWLKEGIDVGTRSEALFLLGEIYERGAFRLESSLFGALQYYQEADTAVKDEKERDESIRNRIRPLLPLFELRKAIQQVESFSEEKLATLVAEYALKLSHSHLKVGVS